MNLILNIHDAVTRAARLLRHHLFHQPADFLREWGNGEVFLRCQQCGWRSHGIQIGPQRLTTQSTRHSARHRLETSA